MALSIGGGAKAVELTYKQDDSYLSVVTSYWKRPKPPEHHTNEIITWASFDHYVLEGATRKCLVMAYTTGFQVWDIEDMNDVREVCSRRDVSIKVARFLAGPGALLALASNEDAPSFPRTAVRLFSLRRRDYVKGIRFATEVLNIFSSARVLVVALRDRLFGFDPVSAERVFNIETYPSPVPWQVAALGTRWLAYAGRGPVGPPGTARPERGALAKLATDMLKGAVYLGDMGVKGVTTFLNGPDAQPVVSPTQTSAPNSGAASPTAGNLVDPQEPLEGVGSVVVYDVVTQRNVAHFYAHAQPISVLSWDQSGSLLTTADFECRSFHVYRISPDETASASGSPPPQLYRLWRGMTSASVLGVSLSSDARWLAACSARGTTHVYAVYPLGGPPLTLTHVPPTTPNRVPGTPGYVFGGRVVPQIELASVHRIKAGTPIDQNVKFSQAATFVGQRQIVQVSGTGVLSLYTLEPHAAAIPATSQSGEQGQAIQPGSVGQGQIGGGQQQAQTQQDAAEAEAAGLQLAVSVRRIGQWDVCRKSTMQEFCSPVFAEQAAGSGASPPPQPHASEGVGWLSNVEMLTHASHTKPIWASPLFTFHSFVPRAAAAPVAPRGDDEDDDDVEMCDETTPTRRVEVHRETPALSATARVYDENLMQSVIDYIPGHQHGYMQMREAPPQPPAGQMQAADTVAQRGVREAAASVQRAADRDQPPQQHAAAQPPAEDLLAAMMTPMHAAPANIVDRSVDEAARPQAAAAQPVPRAVRAPIAQMEQPQQSRPIVTTATLAPMMASTDLAYAPVAAPAPAPAPQALEGQRAGPLVSSGGLLIGSDSEDEDGPVFDPFGGAVPRGIAGRPQ